MAAALTRASSPSRAVRFVAIRELTDQLTSLRFLIVGLLAVGLTPLAVYVGVRDYQSRLAEHDRLAAEVQKLSAGNEGKQVRGLPSSWSGEALQVLRALRPPEALSVLVRGLDGGQPEYWDFSPTGIEVGPPASRPQRLVDVLGQLDFEFLLRVVLGLLAILLAFDAVAGEKELGTLRAVLSQPISRAAFLAGKLLGGVMTLWFCLAVAFLIALFASQFLGIDLLSRDILTRAALIAATSAAYLTCFYALGLVVSSVTSSQKTSLVVLLVVWVLAVLAIPPLATLIAQAASPVPPAQAVEFRKQRLDESLSQEADQAMGSVYREVTGLPLGWFDGSKFDSHKDEMNRRIAPIVVSYLARRRQATEELDRDFERRAARQNQFAHWIMDSSPAAGFASATADLAGTGDATAAAWRDAVRQQQSRLDSVLFDDPPTVVIQNGGSYGWVDRRTPPSVNQLPAFVPPRRDAAAALARALPALGLLIGYTGVFIVAGFVAFARYDVR
jgi:ABC-type transport system involved in multi-copper enzyme maturation permease subunit